MVLFLNFLPYAYALSGAKRFMRLGSPGFVDSFKKLSLFSSLQYHPFGKLILSSGFNAQCRLAPRRFRSLHADWIMAFTAAVGMINRIFRFTAHSRFNAHMPHSPGLADTNQTVLTVANYANGRAATL